METVFYDRSGARVIPPASIKARPKRYSAIDQGGPKQAEIEITGADPDAWAITGWLRYGVEILDDSANSVWWGYVNQVRIESGAVSISYTLGVNRIRVVYQLRQTDGSVLRAVTADADNAYSQAYYNVIKEQVIQGGDLSDTAAAALRDETLAAFAFYQPALEIGRGNEAVKVTLDCLGYWYSLNWRYAAVAARDILNLVRNQYGPYGFNVTYFPWGFTNGALGDWTGELWSGQAYSVAQSFILPTSGARSPVRVDTVAFCAYKSGTEGTVSVKIYADAPGQPGQLLGTLTAKNASEFSDNGGWVAFSAPAAPIWLMPGARYWAVMTRNASYGGSQIRFFGTDNTNGPALEKHLVQMVSGGGWGYYPGKSVNDDVNLRVSVSHSESMLTAGATSDKQRIAQSFVIGGSQALDVTTVKVLAAKGGAPAHTMTFTICADSAGAPGAAIGAGGTLDSSGLTTELEEYTIALTGVSQLTAGAVYWLVIERAGGALDPSNFVMFAASLAYPYTGGVTKVFNGSAWATPVPNVELLFDLYTALDTTRQIANLINSYGQLLGAVTITTASAMYTNSARDGDTDALSEIGGLLSAGTAAGRRITARVLRDKTVVLDQAPAAVATAYITRTGRLIDVIGAVIRPEAVPVGFWLAPRDITPAGAPVAPLGAAAAWYVEESEYDVAARVWRPRLRGQRDAYNFGGVNA